MGNKLSEISNNNLMMNYKKTDDIFADMQGMQNILQMLLQVGCYKLMLK